MSPNGETVEELAMMWPADGGGGGGGCYVNFVGRGFAARCPASFLLMHDIYVFGLDTCVCVGGVGEIAPVATLGLSRVPLRVHQPPVLFL